MQRKIIDTDYTNYMILQYCDERIMQTQEEDNIDIKYFKMFSLYINSNQSVDQANKNDVYIELFKDTI